MVTAAIDPAEPPAQPAVRRFLTLLFSDLCGSTQLAAALEAEHYADIIGQLREAYRSVIPRHGGTVVRIQGDGVLAIFGHPEALEDDGRRAAEAALELHAAVRAIRPDPPLPDGATLRLHSGIHAGLVLLAQGDLMSGRFELMGNAPNVAARLSDAAQPDEILVSDETLGPERQLFVTGGRRLFDLQGLSSSVAVLSILSRAGGESRFRALAPRGTLPFVGRQAEMERLETALQAALAGRPASLTLSAAAGLGKTRLAEQWLRRCEDAGCRVHRGYCESQHGTRPLQPLIHILRTLFDLSSDMPMATAAAQVEERLVAIAPELRNLRAPLLQVLAIDDQPAEAERPRRAGAPDATPRALRKLMAALARQQPQVLFIDDWQWADDATHQALAAIHQLDGDGIVTLVTTRTARAEQPMPPSEHAIELQPLTGAEAAQYIGQLLPGADPFLVDQIRYYAGGSPLFIEELCHCAVDDAEVRRSGRLQRGAAWLNVLIESRVARLPDAQAALVRSAAIIGNVMPVWLFEAITGLPAEHASVRQLAQLDLLFPGEQPGTLRFKHALARDAIYEAVGLHQRKALHLRIAQTLLEQGSAVTPGEDHCEALAYHFDAAGVVEQAARFAEQAGDKALAASALDRAQARYRVALAALDRCEPSAELAPRWNSISQRLALASVFNPARSDLPLFTRAVALARASGDGATLARATYWLGYVHYSLGDARSAMQQLELAMAAAAAAGDARLGVQVRATLGQVKAAAAQYDAALILLDEAIAISRAHPGGPAQAVGLGYTLASKGAILADRGDFASAKVCFDEALEVVQGTGHAVLASIHGLRAAALLWQGEWQAASESADEACRIGERVRSLFTLSMGRAAGAYARWMLDPRPEVLAELKHATDWLVPRGVTLFSSFNHGWLSDILAGSGRRREARLQAAQALRRWRQDDLLGVAMACRAMARLESKAADAIRAERWLARARRVASARGSAHEHAVNLLCEAEVALALGQSERAGPLLEAARAECLALGMNWHAQQAERLRSST
ncbi:ATP-binding protein [Rivibacter subsaxonicus]|nr:adenylate/guanylate cyclase domain-containing protein [Rivibacter subsaxonicus]